VELLDRLRDFFVANVPPWRAVAIGAPLGLAWAASCLAFAGWLKRRGARTGDTRKLFHFLVFGTVALAHRMGGTPLVCLFGAMVSLVVFYAVWRGDGHPMYEALAREKDAPRRRHYILAPWFATFVGGVASNLLFGSTALVGYLVAGLADAIAEPIGIRFGRHRYPVPSLAAVKATRSIEGSCAVLVASIAAIALAVALSPQFTFVARHAFAIPALALLATLVEAVSPHGWDNATLQLVPTWAATLLL
jgi:phytol kinase